MAATKPSFAAKQALDLAFKAKNVSCNGLNDGKIDLTIKGGTAPYTIAWNHGSNALHLTALEAGMYHVTVTDAKGNTALQTISISEPYLLSVHGNTVDEQCHGQNGSVNVRITGGTYPPAFNWSNGSTSQNLQNVSAGDYTVTVTDANGCRTNASFNVGRKRTLQINAHTYGPLCTNDETGLIDIDIAFGQQPYTFKWSNGATSEDISGLAAGNYQVMVSDKNNCSATAEIKLQNPLPIVIEPVIADAHIGKNNGSIALNVSGGVGGYTYLWSTLDRSNWLKNIEEGVYAVKVTDKNGCFESDFYTVRELAPMQVTANVYDLLCHQDNTGLIDLHIEGGKKPYSIKWSNGSVFEDLAGMQAGNYNVMVTDANGKTISKSFFISQPEALNVFATVSDETAQGKADGQIALHPTGGTLPYTFSWNNKNDEQVSSMLLPGIYTVLVTDAHRCQINHEILVSTQQANETAENNTYMQMLRLSKTENDADEEIYVYPNPFNATFTIRLNNVISAVESIQIFSLDGKLVKNISTANLSVSNNFIVVNNIKLSNGNYFIKINTAGKTYSKIITRHI